MKLGAMDNVVGRATDEAFARAQRVGLAGVEINLSIKPIVAGDRSALDAVMRASEESSLPVCSAVLGEHNSGGLATWWRGPDADNEVRAALDACGTLGCRDLLVPFFFFNEPKGRAHRAAVAKRIRPLAQHAADVGVRFCFEGVNTAAEMLEIIAAVDSPAFGIYYDPANATWCDYDIVRDAQVLGKKLFRSHLKESATFTGDAHLGAGRVDHAAYARVLKEIGYDNWLVLETPGGSDEAVRQDVDFARKVYG